ncbi:MAG: DUF1444 family protein [Thiobacillus sp.]|uniref:DUF1444 family protein n=1 Tax=Thiobacillus sp. TaxID=924 RepID=UPI002734ABF7|nr:DUF1444 family protein [Thiobacillus sp.]MDP3585789.1 DUF1444 family protein [Thiobacillus sp.]
MNTSDRDFCLQAIAYLKVVAPDGGPVFNFTAEDSPVLIDIGHGLLVGYIVDMGTHFSYVQQRHLVASEVTQDELHKKAVQNLASLAEVDTKVQQHGNIYVVLMGGNFEASLILLSEFWTEWYSQLAPNNFVAAFPARDILAFTDSSNEQGITELKELCSRCSTDVDHPLTTQIFSYVSGSWQPHG